MALVGGPRILSAMEKVALDPKWKEFLLKFPELRKRVVDDPAFSELSLDKRLEEFQKKGFAAMQVIDAYAASATVAAAYELALARKGLKVDFSKVDPEAAEFAMLMLRRSQSSSYFKDQSFALTRGGLTGNRSIDKALLQFKSFVLNRWSVVRYDLPQMYRKDKAAAAQALMYIAMANAASVGVKWGARSLIAAVLAGAGLVVKESLEDEDSYAEDVAREFLGMVPFVPEMVQMAVYRRAPMPSAEPFFQVGQAAYRGYSAAKAQDGRKALKAIGNAVTAMATMAGIPGTIQAAQIGGMVMDDGSIRFPYSDELGRLDKLVDKHQDTAEERSRWTQLKVARKRFQSLNHRYKAAIEAGETEQAAILARQMAEAMEPYK
jgi:hypothetical protein